VPGRTGATSFAVSAWLGGTRRRILVSRSGGGSRAERSREGGRAPSRGARSDWVESRCGRSVEVRRRRFQDEAFQRWASNANDLDARLSGIAGARRPVFGRFAPRRRCVRGLNEAVDGTGDAARKLQYSPGTMRSRRKSRSLWKAGLDVVVKH
jgi:hypothetical protein